MFKVGVMLILC